MTDQSQKPEKADVEKTKVVAAIGYISILCFIPLLLERDSKYAQFHAKQGIVLLVVEVAIFLLSGVLAFIPVLGWLVLMILNISVVVLAIMGIIKALDGELWEMPVLGQYAKKINI